MVLLDTNVISELTKPTPNERVLKWLAGIDSSSLWICSITIAEMLLGLATMPDGNRKTNLMARAAQTIDVFSKTCASFDSIAATEYAAIAAKRRKLGRPISFQDAQIAAIARAVGLTLATRNVKDFSDIDGLTVIDPWNQPGA
ncbi:MAG: type II toxin-antitoxin system VapC family toxin [Vicinamibacterales bacterium]